jgi:iron complex outermembrane receptor protein
MYTLAMLSLQAQVSDSTRCRAVLRGRVVDELSGTPLEYAVVSLPQLAQSQSADSTGRFRFTRLCAGSYAVRVTFMRDTLDTVLRTGGDTMPVLRIRHLQEEEVQILGERTLLLTRRYEFLNASRAKVGAEQGTTLGQMLSQVPGVTVLQTGGTIFKPVIHGLSGNRVLLYNDGIRIEGQQWGNEHAPEIDPFFADELLVQKGSTGLLQASDAIAGTINARQSELLYADTARRKARLEGQARLVGATNGRMGMTNLRLDWGAGGRATGLVGRIQGTWKRAGNYRTANYHADNTGVEELNLDARLGWRRGALEVQAGYTLFTTRLGIFSGAHLGSVQDLEEAIRRDRPLTLDRFRYTLARPRQEVMHHLAVLKGSYQLKARGQLVWQFSHQQNLRREYDVPNVYNRRSGPQLEFELQTQQVDLRYESKPARHWWKLGAMAFTQGNVWSGRFLIPNFRNVHAGLYGQYTYSRGKLRVEATARVDYRWLRAYLFDSSQTEVLQPTHQFVNAAGQISVGYRLFQSLGIHLMAGSTWRPPSVNELYSNGVHHGTASYERGDGRLGIEQAANLSLRIDGAGRKFRYEALAYNYYFFNFLYLAPANRPVFTVRGAFPSFNWAETRANLSGLDVFAEHSPTKWLTYNAKAALLFARDLRTGTGIVWTPAHRLEGNLGLNSPWTTRTLTRAFVGFGVLGVFRNEQVSRVRDYAAAPPGYVLLNLQAGVNVLAASRHLLEFRVSVQNLGNTTYRDYTDRFRYFLDAMGINALFEVRYRLFDALR